MSKPLTGVRQLDAELSRRLDETLDASTKFELEALRVLETLEMSEKEGSPNRPPEKSPAPAEGQEYPKSPAGDTPSSETAEANRPQAEVLAKVVFEDGDAFHFLAIPADGEIGLSYTGRNSQRWAAATSELVSPLRLYVSIAPPDAPLPWLLAAVDKQKDRLALVGSRRLGERVDEPLEAQSGPGGTLQLRVPTLPGGVWIPDEYTIGGYCGWNGEDEWWLDWCWALGGSGLGPLLEPNIFQCTSEISTEVTHKSIQDGAWRRRKCATAQSVACASPVRIRHQYRKLKLFQWKWVTCNDDVLGPMQVAQGTLWLGLVRRRRQIVYERQGGIGGFRAWSMFSRNLSGGA
jgi:hypothetical protein